MKTCLVARPTNQAMLSEPGTGKPFRFVRGQQQQKNAIWHFSRSTAAVCHECGTSAALWARVMFLVLRTFTCKVQLCLMKIFEYFSFPVVSPTDGAIHTNHECLSWPVEHDKPVKHGLFSRCLCHDELFSRVRFHWKT